jgi:hypothetical protein
MSGATVAALALAIVSSILTNLAYSREHDAAARLPTLTLRHPLGSAKLLLEDRSWVAGFALEGGGFILYALALSFGSLALVQSVAAGGIGVLAWASAHAAHRRLEPRERAGVAISILGLLLLGVSLQHATGEGHGGNLPAILVWLGATGVLAAAVLHLGPRLGLSAAVARGLAGGLAFSIGDISTKLATSGGVRTAFLLTLVAGYLCGTALLQSGYQERGGAAVRVAGLATLVTNALPIAAGTLLLEEPVPTGALGVVRALAFGAVVCGAFLLAHEDDVLTAATAHARMPHAPGVTLGRRRRRVRDHRPDGKGASAKTQPMRTS